METVSYYLLNIKNVKRVVIISKTVEIRLILQNGMLHVYVHVGLIKIRSPYLLPELA